MKKTVIKGITFFITFVVALVVIGRIMNKDHNNMTMEMAAASLPVITMEKAGVSYNHLHGYRQAMDVAFQRDTVTVLGENRDISFVVDTYGRNVTGISIEVRSTDGSRLIENPQVSDYQQNGRQITAEITLKDLIEKDEEYALILLLELDGKEEIRYYTRIIWSDTLHEMDKLLFVQDFHQRLYNREAAKELTKYLETDSRLEDNSSFHKVTIHSSFKQITWGDLAIEEVEPPVLQLKEIANQTATLLMDYMVLTRGQKDIAYYRVQEYYRVRYTPDRMYLLDYERTMTQIPEVEDMYANNKILFGITGVDIPLMESTDGNVVVFETADRLCSYNVTTNRLAVIFSFYNTVQRDERSFYDQHNIKILDVDEGGNVRFAVYGYMNRGRHEGEVGIQIYAYDSALNTIEELIYIPYEKAFSVLESQMQQLLYLNREQQLYLVLDHIIYSIDLTERTYHILVNITRDDSIQVSDNHRILVWQEGDIYHCRKLSIRDLNTDSQITIETKSGEAIRPLGFSGEDVIYGIAREEDITEESSGRIFFPMYKVCICNSQGRLLKEYSQESIYVTECTVEDNQITLERLQREENGSYQTAMPDHIMSNLQQETGKNVIVTADIDIYERYVQLQVRNTIDPKSIQILTPKEVVFEGGRNLALLEDNGQQRYYVYGPYGVSGIFSAPANAVNQAYNNSGVVVDSHGSSIWRKGNRVTRNQIMAIREPEEVPEGESLAACLDAILKYEGLVRNSAYLLKRGETVLDILQDNLEDVEILDLTGCNLDSVLHYVNQDIPVLALLKNGEAVLITGFNEYNVVLFEPVTGRLYKNGMNDTAKWLEENGNSFITYFRKE
ncbi:MAG: hypothetical protein NC081_01145 [Roseburia sp.]|nr:hypothetical protein [Roseburia sp.]